jgi:hypothetical protein
MVIRVIRIIRDIKFTRVSGLLELFEISGVFRHVYQVLLGSSSTIRVIS